VPAIPADAAFADRFWSLVAPADRDGHRWWLGGTFTDDGYPIFTWTGDDGRRWKFRANRVALALTVPLPSPGLLALHSRDCSNPGCSAPAHLRWGTAADNSADRDSPVRRLELRTRRDAARGQLALILFVAEPTDSANRRRD
jgi:hypothetical protein